MSTVILQVGQCGNQIGKELWTVLNSDKANKLGYIFFFNSRLSPTHSVSDCAVTLCRSRLECSHCRCTDPFRNPAVLKRDLPVSQPFHKPCRGKMVGPFCNHLIKLIQESDHDKFDRATFCKILIY